MPYATYYAIMPLLLRRFFVATATLLRHADMLRRYVDTLLLIFMLPLRADAAAAARLR